MMASRLLTPSFIALCALSVTTIALSTSIPIAIIKPASDVRFNPSPIVSITTNVPPIVNISDEPIIMPALNLIATIIMAITIATESARLIRKSFVASAAILSSG